MGGGSEVLWSSAAQHAAKNGHAVAAFFPYFKNIPQTRELGRSIDGFYYGSPAPTRWWHRITQIKGTRTERFRDALTCFRPDVVVINQGNVRDGLSEMETCRQLGLRYVIINQAVEPLNYPDDIWRNLRKAFESARWTWFVSVENQEQLSAYLSLDLIQSEVITNAYDCPLDNELPWPDDDQTNLAVLSRLDLAQKGHDILFEALAIGDWSQRRVSITLGGEGPAIDQLNARRLKLGLDYVNILGHNAKVNNIWRTHHALVLPSRFEGQSLAMLEAMLHGRPVICTPVGGTKGVVIDGHTGFIASHTGHANALADTLERAWTERSRWREIGLNARTLVRGLVSPNPGAAIVEKITKL